MDFKFIFSNNGVLTDKTVEMSNYYSGSTVIPVIADEDAIFIGVRYPLNSIYLKVGVANDQTSNMSVSYWSGSSFESVVELLDETSVNGVTLAQSGHITFVPDKNNKMVAEDTSCNNGNENITGLGDVTIYDRFWYKITFNNDLNVSTALSFMGNMFLADNDIKSIYPDLLTSEVLSRYETGKTDWEEQRYVASDMVIKDLIAARVIVSGNQLLRREKMKTPTVFKTAELIYTSFGSDYEDDRANARNNYLDSIKMDIYDIDTNNNAILETKETANRMGQLYR